SLFFFTPPPPPDISTLSLHDALPILSFSLGQSQRGPRGITYQLALADVADVPSPEAELHDPLSLASHLRPARSRARVLLDPDHRSEEHTSELQSRGHLVCRLLLEKKK